jgi:GntR family transcriptional regulator, rspAB operon transcriptional repressor
MATVQPLSSRERVRGDIVDLAVAGEIEPGVSTSENKIAKMLGGTRSPTIREGLALLVSEGMFEQVPQVGVKLRPPSAEEVEKILAMRSRLEGLVVEALAAEEDPEPVIADAVQVNAEAFKVLADPIAFGRESALFHRELARAAGYETGALSIRTWTDRLRVYEAIRERERGETSQSFTWVFQTTRAATEVVNEHSAILDAIRSRDPAAAGEALAEHLERTRERLTDDRRPSGTPEPAQVKEEAEILLARADDFIVSGVLEAAGFAVTLAAGLYFELGKHRDAARILGSPVCRSGQALITRSGFGKKGFPTPSTMEKTLRKKLGPRGFAQELDKGKRLDVGSLSRALP